MPTDEFKAYERFIYKQFERNDTAPPHGVWDALKGEWAGVGAWSTEELARACASGMNAARELFKQDERRIDGALSALDRARDRIARLR